MKKNVYVLGGCLLLLVGCETTDKVVYSDMENPKVIVLDENGNWTDTRDGEQYKVIKIGGDYWFAENLRYVDNKIKNDTWCYNDESSNCQKYGRLYSWFAAKNACPENWKLPSDGDWNYFSSYIGNLNHYQEGIGTSLKSTSGWKDKDGVDQGTNRFGFNAYPSGRRNAEGDGFLPMGNYAFFWTSTYVDEAIAKGMALNYDRDVFEIGEFYQEHGMSVRCMVKGTNISYVVGEVDSSYIKEIPHPYGSMVIGKDVYKTVKVAGSEWMAENVNYSTGKSWCYGNDEKNCDKYGRLYDYKTAQSICPEGWRLPSQSDFATLGSNFPANELRGGSEWNSGSAINLWGMNILPSGAYGADDGFFDRGMSAYFWVESDTKLNGVYLYYNGSSAFTSSKEYKETSGLSVRCIKDDDGKDDE